MPGVAAALAGSFMAPPWVVPKLLRAVSLLLAPELPEAAKATELIASKAAAAVVRTYFIGSFLVARSSAPIVVPRCQRGNATSFCAVPGARGFPRISGTVLRPANNRAVAV